MMCPGCSRPLSETVGSPISPYINVYSCICGFRHLRCGSSSCDGYLDAGEYTGTLNSYRYTCTKCGWTGTGGAFNTLEPRINRPAPPVAVSPAAARSSGRHWPWRRRKEAASASR